MHKATIALHVRDKMKKVVRFTASWCQPCKALAKNLESIETNMPIEVVDIDDDIETATLFGIRSVPTLIMFDENQNILKRTTGLKTKEQLESWLND